MNFLRKFFVFSIFMIFPAWIFAQTNESTLENENKIQEEIEDVQKNNEEILEEDLKNLGNSFVNLFKDLGETIWDFNESVFDGILNFMFSEEPEKQELKDI